jgi:probable rRNA maturation factor
MEIDPPVPDIEVEISDGQQFLDVDHAALSGLARRTLAAQGIEAASISVALVDNATIHAINRRHLAHDWPTDVISFTLSEPGDVALAGELVISAEMAVATAREAGAEPFAELALYVVHGLLHLCGLDDQAEADAAAMRRREAEILASEGLINTFPLVGPIADAGREGVSWDR